MRNSSRYQQNSFDQRSKQKSGHGCLRSILLTVIFVALIIVFFGLQTQSYASLNKGLKVARVCAYSTAAALPVMYVHLLLYGNDGNVTLDHVYQVSGNQVRLQGDIIKYLSALNSPLPSFYKLTRLEGYYNDPKIEQNYTPAPILLNGGDDTYYQTVHGLPSVTPVVAAIYDKPFNLKGDGYTYDIFVSQDGLFATKANGSLACGLKH
jgi:hypothetical protein